MSLYANSPTTRPSAAIQHTLTRHRDILKGSDHNGQWVSDKINGQPGREVYTKKTGF